MKDIRYLSFALKSLNHFIEAKHCDLKYGLVFFFFFQRWIDNRDTIVVGLRIAGSSV